MTKPPGVFSLLAAAVTGFSSHLVSLCVTAQGRLFGQKKVKGRRIGK